MLFNVQAGLLLYVPLFGVIFLILFYQAAKLPKRFGLSLATMLFFTWLYSTWHSWSYGCGLGIRVYVEWLPLLAFPLAHFISKEKRLRWALFALSIPIVYYNLHMSTAWTGCYFGSEKNMAEFMELFWPNL
jgi:hypothetical protein